MADENHRVLARRVLARFAGSDSAVVAGELEQHPLRDIGEHRDVPLGRRS